MPIIDDRTSNLNLPLPNAANLLNDDVARLRTALTDIDTAVAGKADLVAGKVPADQLPSYVDDVLEFADFASLPATGETGKIYVLLTPHTSGGVTSSQFRWSGSAYVAIVASPGSTDAVPEGSTNRYFTEARARDAVPVASASVAGKVKVGAGLSVAGDGTLSVDGAGETFGDIPLTVSSNGQTVFTIAGGYIPGMLDMHMNGVKLVPGDDFTASNGTTATLAVGAATTDTLIARVWSSFEVADALPKSGGTMGGPLVLAGNAVNPLEAVTKQQMDAAGRAVASTAQAQAGAANDVDITPLRLREALNAGGSAPVYACRAWVNFNGTTTPPTIRASGNVSSVTKNGTGDYTVNFTTAMPDANYAAHWTAECVANTNGWLLQASSYSTTGVRLITRPYASVGFDSATNSVSIFR